MSSSKFQVLTMSKEGINQALEVSLQNSRDIEDYTFEERYCKGSKKVLKPKQDELDRLHYTRLESMFTRSDWEVFCVFRQNYKAHPKKVACVWLDDNGTETERWTYHDLYHRSRNIAYHLHNTYNLKKGDRVLLVYEPSIDFFPAFWACVGLGIIAVPVCPPDPFSPNSDSTEKLVAIVKDCSPTLILTSRTYKDTIAAARTFMGNDFDEIMDRLGRVLDFKHYLWITTTDLKPVSEAKFDFPESKDIGLNERDIAFLQYTSGSTGGAKGVVVQHRTLAANCMNCALLTQGMGSLYVYQFSLGVSWLPTFHDMGLIGFHVAPMLIGGTMIYFSPVNFIQNPILWLKVLSRFKHISTGAPPFALDLCVRRVTPKDLQQIDLSGLEILVLGAEPIRASFMLDFTRKFSPYGFNPKAYMTCFGMAENVLHVAGKWSNQYESRMIMVDSAKLNNSELVVYKDELCSIPNACDRFPSGIPDAIEPLPSENIDSQWLVSSGELLTFSSQVTIDEENHHDVANRLPHFYRKEVASFITIVNPDTKEELPDGYIGEIWICSPSKTIGYWNKDEVNKNNFHAVLKAPSKHDTKRLLHWAKSGAYKRDRGGHKQFEYALFSPEEIVNATTPLIGLVRNCINTKGEVEWLRSGDMGVIYDNNLFITGRIKDMIIIRGTNYYADDIEHCISAGKAGKADLGNGNAHVSSLNKAIQMDPHYKHLSSIRPGSCVAYSITITADSTDSSDARKFNAEGEHLALLVELQADDVLHDSDSEFEADDEQQIENLKKKSKKVKSLQSKNQEMELANKIRRKKHKKFGHQSPLWQRLLIKYGGSLVNGMSNAYEDGEDELLESITGKASTKSRGSCNENIKLLAQQSFITAIKYGINFTQAAIGLVYGKQDNDVEETKPSKNKKSSSQKSKSSSKSDSEASESSESSESDQDSDEDHSKKQKISKKKLKSHTEASKKAIEEKLPHEEENDLRKDCLRHLPTDAETAKMKKKYSDKELEDIASAIRATISAKFLLSVGRITFLSPKSIKKTSSGKKRRSDMISAVHDGYLDHRIVKISHTRVLAQYVKQKGDKSITVVKNSVGSGSSHFASKTHKISENIIRINKIDMKYAELEKTDDFGTYEGPVSAIAISPSDAAKIDKSTRKPSNTKSYTSKQKSSKTITEGYGGTVGVSLDDREAIYNIAPKSSEENIVAKARREAFDNQNSSSPRQLSLREFAKKAYSEPEELLPPLPTESRQLTKEEAYQQLQNLKETAQTLTFEKAKNRILTVIVKELREIVALPVDEESESSSSYLDVSPEQITVEFLQEMSEKSSDEQQASLQAYGLDSMTGFKIAKSLASEFNISQSLMGPHLFLQDPTIDGMVKVMVQLVQLQAKKAEESYINEYEGKLNRKQSINEMIESDYSLSSHNAYRGCADIDRIPYILGIGTAVPAACAPQIELIQAMLPAMEMDSRSEERFLKIAANSGIQTRYSALDSLRNVFWGKKKVNCGSDEYIDARQKVYKRESVKLSIRAAADCLNDWMQQRPAMTDEDRDLERLKKFIQVEEKHRRDLELEEEAELLEAQALEEKKGKKTRTKEQQIEPIASTEAPPTKKTTYQKTSPLEDDFSYDLTHLSKTVTEATKRTITHVVAVTCTGIIVPGLEFHIMNALGLPNTTQRLSIQFMGCFGAISGIRCASALASENPKNRVLVVCCELCSLHMQLDNRIDNLVATALFADGAGAFVVGCSPTEYEKPLFAVESCSSYIISNTIEQMAWELSKTGLLVGLAKEIAGEIFNHIGDFVDDMLKYCPDEQHPQHRVRTVDCNLAIHPGGPLIINSIQSVLGVAMVGDGHGGGEMDKNAPTYECWKILQEYGNMSSATLVFVLDRMRENPEKTNKWTPTIAFGPGLSIEGALLKSCF